MNAARIVGIVLIVAGIAALALGGYSFDKETAQARIGPLQFSVKERQTVQFPTWAGVTAIVIGGALVLLGGGKR